MTPPSCTTALSAANNPGDNCFAENGETVCLTASTEIKQEEVSLAAVSALPPESDWSSDNPTGGVSGNADDLTFIPMAEDAVGVAEELVGDSSSAEVSNFNTGALAAIYTGGTYTRDPGTHTVGDVFETSIDGTDYPYVVSSINRSGAITGDEQVILVANETGKAAELDNDANADLKVTNINDALAGNSPSYTVPTTSPAIAIVPFSGAQLIMQEHGLTASTLGNADFPAINGETLDNGVTGSGAAVGSLQERSPTVRAPWATSTATCGVRCPRATWARPAMPRW